MCSRRLLLLFIVAFLIVQHGSTVLAQGIITTCVGNGTAGYSGDGGTADTARIYSPFGVCLDNSSNLYFADGSGLIRRVDAVTNIITTVGGSLLPGYSSDGGPAVAARIGRHVQFLFADGSGNILFSTDSTVGKISTAGIYSVVAGNPFSAGSLADSIPALNARITNGCIVADVAGNIYLSQQNTIRKIDRATGIITTIAGSVAGYGGDGGPATAALFNSISAIVLDNYGNLLIADQDNGCIRKMNLASGVVTRVAGVPGAASIFTGIDGLAIDASLGYVTGICTDIFGNIYMDGFDGFGHYSCKITRTTGVISLLAGSLTLQGFAGDAGPATAAKLSYPLGMCIQTTTGTVFIADHDNNRIRKVTQPGFNPLSVNDVAAINNFNVYPNPVTEKLNIEMLGVANNAAFKVSNTIGNVVHSGFLNSKMTEIAVEELPAGVYFVSVQLDGVTYVKRIMK